MPSFGFLASLAFVALATFTSAAPAPGGGDQNVNVVAVPDAAKNVNINSAIDALIGSHVEDIDVAKVQGGHHLRDDGASDPIALALASILSKAKNPVQQRSEPRSLPVILADVTAKITPACNKLTALAAADITIEVVGPICKEITDVVISATAEVKLLVGLPVDHILLFSGKVLALVDVAKLVADLLCLILGALAGCLKVVATAKVAVILPLLSAVGIVVGDLCATIFLAVHGLLPLVLGLICKIVPALFRLKLYAFIAVLGL